MFLNVPFWGGRVVRRWHTVRYAIVDFVVGWPLPVERGAAGTHGSDSEMAANALLRHEMGRQMFLCFRAEADAEPACISALWPLMYRLVSGAERIFGGGGVGDDGLGVCSLMYLSGDLGQGVRVERGREDDGNVLRLRAVERAPRFVADERVLDALAPRDRSRGIEREKIRAYRLILLLLQVNARNSPGYRIEAPWEVPVNPDPATLATLSGLSRQLIEETLGDLRRIGALIPSDSGEHLSEPLFAPNLSAAGLDWPWIVDRLAGLTSGLMVIRAMADLIRYPSEWTPLLQPELAAQAAYSSRAVRDALHLVEERGVVERDARQKLGVYRFSARARGIRSAERQAEDQGWPAPSAISQDAPHLSDASTAVKNPQGARTGRSGSEGVIRVSVGGIELQVPQGSSIRPVVGVDGRPRLTVALPGLPEMVIELPVGQN